MAQKKKPTVKDGEIAIPVPKRSDLARVLKTAAQPLRPRRPKKKRPE